MMSVSQKVHRISVRNLPPPLPFAPFVRPKVVVDAGMNLGPSTFGMCFFLFCFFVVTHP